MGSLKLKSSQPAYKLGLIDKDGNLLVKRSELKNRNEKDALTYFDLIIINLKKQLRKYSPILYRRDIANVVTAMRYLMKESAGMEHTPTPVLDSVIRNWYRAGCPVDEKLARHSGRLANHSTSGSEILKETKNSLLKQYRKLFLMEGADLHFTREAILTIADRALEMKTGARALRSIDGSPYHQRWDGWDCRCRWCGRHEHRFDCVFPV